MTMAGAPAPGPGPRDQQRQRRPVMGIPYVAPTTGIVPAPAVGEFRLAPGNLQPVGVVRATTCICRAPALPYVSFRSPTASSSRRRTAGSSHGHPVPGAGDGPPGRLERHSLPAVIGCRLARRHPDRERRPLTGGGAFFVVPSRRTLSPWSRRPASRASISCTPRAAMSPREWRTSVGMPGARPCIRDRGRRRPGARMIELPSGPSRSC